MSLLDSLMKLAAAPKPAQGAAPVTNPTQATVPPPAPAVPPGQATPAAQPKLKAAPMKLKPVGGATPSPTAPKPMAQQARGARNVNEGGRKLRFGAETRSSAPPTMRPRGGSAPGTPAPNPALFQSAVQKRGANVLKTRRATTRRTQGTGNVNMLKQLRGGK